MVFCAVSVLFAFAGFKLLRTIRDCFPSFYIKVKRNAVFIVVVQVVAYSLRSVLNLYLFFDEDEHFNTWYENSVSEDSWFAPIYILVFTSLGELLPIAAKLLSLNFSFKEKVKAVQLTLARGDMFLQIDAADEQGGDYMWSDFRLANSANSLSDYTAFATLLRQQQSGMDDTTTEHTS